MNCILTLVCHCAGHMVKWCTEAARMRWLDSTTGSTGGNLSKLWAMAEERGAWWAAVHGVSGLDTA